MKRNSPTATSPPGPDISALEARVMMSAAPLPADVAIVEPETNDAAPVDAGNQEADAAGDGDFIFSDSEFAASTSEENTNDAGSDEFIYSDDTANLTTAQPELDVHQVTVTAPVLPADFGEIDSKADLRQELVFVDAGIEDLNQLLKDLWANDDPTREIEVVLISSGSDGLQTITSTLAARSGLDAIHIVSHGSDGQVQLGNTALTSENFGLYQEQIAAWGNSLNTGAELLLYGCDLAGTATGRDLINAIGAACNCDVAASNDLTGAAELGGDWDLEYSTGEIETSIAFSSALQVSWQGTLDITSNLVAHYEFEENSGGTAGDSTANNNDGSLTNAPVWDGDAAVGDYALDFAQDAGSNAFVTVADDASFDFSGDFSVAFWYNASSPPGGNAGIVGQYTAGNGFAVYATSDGNLQFLVEGGSGSVNNQYAGGFISDGDWHHVVAVRSGDNFQMYVDGVSNTATTSAIGSPNSTEALFIGGGSTSDYEGKLDDVRIYTRAVSTSDVGELMTLTLDPLMLDATSSANGGLNINDDGGNDIYLVADDSPFSGQAATTIEVEFSSDSPATDVTTLFSYADPTNQDELFLGVDAGGELFFRTSEDGGAGYGSITHAPQLFDGETHTVAVTWENATGILKFYVDGEELGIGRNSYQTGATIDAGGAVVIGQRQGAPESSFDTNDTFSGTIYNVRVFDHVRTDEQLAASYQSDLPFDENGMLAQWVFDNLSTGGVVTETVSGNNLTLKHTSEGGFSSSEAELTFTLNENALDGAFVGVVTGVDAEREAQIAALLDADPDLVYSAETGKFYKAVSSSVDWNVASTSALGTTLNGVNGQLAAIRSATEQQIAGDIVASAGYELWLGATDQTVEGEHRWTQDGADADQFWSGDETGESVDGAYSNWLAGRPDNSGGNQNYVFIRTDGFWNEEILSYSTGGYLVEWDADEVLDATDALTYSISSQSLAGAFEIDADSGEIRVADGSLLDADTLATHVITVRTTDVDSNTYDQAFSVSLNNLADANQTVPGPQSVNEDTVLTFTGANAVSVSDSIAGTDAPMQVTLSVNNGVLNLSTLTGITIVDGADGSSLMTFNGDESAINAALDGLTFTPVSNYNGSVSLKMTTSLEADQEGFYNFEGGNANDQNAGTSHDGVFNGDAATTMDADRGEVLTLDGAGDFVQINSTFGSPSSVTIGGWVNFTGTGRQEFISLDDRFHIALDDGGNGVKGSFQTGPGTFNDLESNVYLADTGWRHVAYTYDDAAATHSLYIDGELVASESVVNPIDWAGATTTYIGQHPGGINYLNGSVDDARIFSRALSANEIAAMAGEQFEVTGDVAITVNAVNDQPVFNNLDGNPTFVEGGPAVVLDQDVTFFDIDIDRGEDVYTNIDLTLSRNGGANAEDVFSATGNLIFQGNNDLELSGVVVGTVVSNSGGTLNLRFNGAANEANVNEVLQSIAYSNSSDTPPASVTIDWSMEDSNGTAQGSGGNLFATGSTTVNIVDSPENAVITVPIGQAVNEDTVLTFSSAGGNAITVDSGSGFDPVVTTTLSVGNGTLTLSGVTGITFLDGTSNGGATLTIAGTQTDINNALDGLQYQGGLNYNGSDTLTVTTGTHAAIEANLHARYEFLNGSLEDETANGYDGAASGDPALTSDAERGDVLTFDGNDRVDVANSVSTLGDQVTIAAWVNLDAGQQDNIFLSIGDEFYVILDNSNPSLSMGLHVNGFTTNSLSSTHNIAGEGWNHVAATFNDVTKETHLYLNGELVRMSTFAFSDVDWSMADSPNITIGSLSDGSNAFTGSLDDVRVYNSELSESDIVAVMGDNGFDTENVSVTVNAVNDTPGVAGPGSAYNVNERTNLPIEGTGFTVSDIDAASGVATATFEVGEGTITIVEGDSGITITGGNGSDTVTFTGTVAEIDALLRGSSTGTITYYNGSFTPSASTTITLTVNDGGNTGSDPGLTADAASEEDAASQTININALNSEPVIASLGGDTLSYTEGDGQQAIDQAAGAVVTDIDSSDFDTGTLTVSFNAGSDSAEDVLSVINTGMGASQIGVSGSNVTYEGVTIGAFTGGASGVDLVVTLNANANADAVSALIRNISYENTDTTNPTTTDRTVRFVLTDGDGGVSTNYDTTIEVASNNQAPLVSLANTTTTISEDTDTSSAIKVADIVISDDGEGVNSLSLSGADAALFEIVGTELRLVAGASLDFETNSTLDVTVQVDDAAVGGSPDDTAPLAITVTDANEAPTVSLANTTTTIAEDTDTSSAIKVADIVVNDDALGTNTLSLTGADAALFEIVGTELRLVAGASLDFETNSTLDVTVQVDDAAVGGSPDDTAPLAITVTDANEAPTVSLANTTTTISEDTDTSSAIKVADIVVNDDALGTNTLSLTGADAALFEIVGTELRLVAGASLDFETNSTLDVTVQVDDAAVGGSPDDTAPLAITVTDANEAPTVSLANTTTTIAENTDTSSAIKVADIVVNDDALGTNTLSLTGADAALFEIVGTELRLVAGASLDFETNSTLDVTVQVDDAAVGGSPDDTAPLAITVTDANEAPTVSLANTTTTISEDTDTSSAIKVADIVVNDDTLGTNTLSLTGADAALFEIVGTELRLVAGASLDFETNNTLDVTVQVDDAAVGGSPDDTAPLAISVTNVNEAPVNSTPGAQVVAEDGSLTFSSADGTAITVSDVDASSLQVTLTAANGRLTLGGTTGLTFGVGDGSDDATIEFTGTKADINTALEGLIFAPDGDYNGAASLQIVTSDLGASGTGGVLTDSDTIAINVTAQNDAPQLAAPAADSTPEDTTLVFSTAGGNAISVSDVDAAGSPLTLNLSVANGALTLASIAGLTFSGGDGSADAAMSFTGDAASINAALDGLMFTPSQDFHGNVALNMMLSDNGNTGAGGTLMAAGSVSVTVTPVNDAPTGQSSSFTGSQNQTLSASVPGVLTGASDVDGDALTAVLVSAPSSGSLSLNADGSFTYDPAFQFTGTVTFSFRVSDGADNSAVHTVQLVIEPAVAPPPPPTTPVDPVEPDPETPEDTTDDSSNETDDSSADEDESAGDESVDQPLAGVRGERGGTGFFSIGEEQPSLNETSDSLETVQVALLDNRNSGGDRTSPTALRAGGGYRDSGVGEFTVDGLDDYQRAQEAMTQPEFQKKLDSMRDEVFLTRNVSLGTATAVTSVASIGYLIWTVRGGYLLASMVSALPAWRMIDPVAVLNDIGPAMKAGENEESLQSMVKEHAGEDG